MLLAQFTANQVPFDALDWLQFGVYFVLLPLVALIGSVIGLLGRIRRGGVLWSTNVGLLGGAVSCVIVALGISTLEGESSTNYFFSFMEVMRWKMLAVALGATWACSFVAAIAWRFLYPPREKQPFAISLQCVLLVQPFAFVSMGSFIGLRLYMLQSADYLLVEYETEYEDPEIPGWISFGRGETLILDDHEVTTDEIHKALSQQRLREISELKQLKKIHLSLEGEWNTDLSILFGPKEYDLVAVDCVNPRQQIIEQLAAAKTKWLSLSGDYSDIDLAPISRSKFVNEVWLSGAFSRQSVESLADSPVLASLSLGSSKLGLDRPSIRRWPPNLTKLSILATSVNNADIAALQGHGALRELDINWVALNDEAIAAIATLTKLESLDATVGPLAQSGLDALIKMQTTTARLHVSHPGLSGSEVAQILRTRGLIYLDLLDAAHGDDVVEALSKCDSLRAISISSSAVTEEAMLLLAQLPDLVTLEYPIHIDTTTFRNGFATWRCELDLPALDHMRPAKPRQPSANSLQE